MKCIYHIVSKVSTALKRFNLKSKFPLNRNISLEEWWKCHLWGYGLFFLRENCGGVFIEGHLLYFFNQFVWIPIYSNYSKSYISISENLCIISSISSLLLFLSKIWYAIIKLHSSFFFYLKEKSDMFRLIGWPRIGYHDDNPF